MPRSILRDILTNPNHQAEKCTDNSAVFDLLNEHSIWGQVSSNHEKIKSFQKRNVVLNLLYKKEFCEFVNLIRSAGVSSPIVPLKGMSLLGRIYPNYSQRQLSDIDIYIPQESKKNLHQILTKNNYKLIEENKWQANSHKRSYEKYNSITNITFEIHFQLYGHSNYQPFLINHEQNEMLGIEDELAYLCYHLAEQHNFIKLFWLLDIEKFIFHFKDQINWIHLKKISKQLNIERSVSSCLYLCFQYLKSNSQPYSSPPCLIQWVLSWSFLCYPRKYKLKYHLLKFYLKDKRAGKYFLGWWKNKFFSNGSSKK